MNLFACAINRIISNVLTSQYCVLPHWLSSVILDHVLSLSRMLSLMSINFNWGSYIRHHRNFLCFIVLMVLSASLRSLDLRRRTKLINAFVIEFVVGILILVSFFLVFRHIFFDWWNWLVKLDPVHFNMIAIYNLATLLAGHFGRERTLSSQAFILCHARMLIFDVHLSASLVSIILIFVRLLLHIGGRRARLISQLVTTRCVPQWGWSEQTSPLAPWVRLSVALLVVVLSLYSIKSTFIHFSIRVLWPTVVKRVRPLNVSLQGAELRHLRELVVVAGDRLNERPKVWPSHSEDECPVFVGV